MSEKISAVPSGQNVTEREPYHCAFCEIRDGRLEASIITKNDDAFAIMALEGHPLVITNTHVTSEDKSIEKNSEEALSAYKLALSLVPAVKRGLNVQGVTLVTNLGEAAGQEIPHFHIHLFGRIKGDRKVTYKDLGTSLSRADLNARADLIKKNIPSSSGAR
jgi:histidine triad (HIT) family protein